MGRPAGVALRGLGRRPAARGLLRGPRRVLRTAQGLADAAGHLAAVGGRLPGRVRTARRGGSRRRLGPHRRGPVGHVRERPRGGACRGGEARRARGGRRRRRPAPAGSASSWWRRRARPRRARTLDAVVHAVHDTRERLDIWFCLDTLEYLRRGGRIGAAQALLGSALQIKPILTFGTEIAPVGRVRTRKRAFERMVAYLEELHERGATDWCVQHAQAHDDAARLVAEGTRSSAPSRCSARRLGRCSAPTSGRGCWSAGSPRRRRLRRRRCRRLRPRGPGPVAGATSLRRRGRAVRRRADPALPGAVAPGEGTRDRRGSRGRPPRGRPPARRWRSRPSHPLQEHAQGQLMLALYRGGRQTEALEVFRLTRARLVDEIGAEPGPEMRRLHEEILHQSPALDLPAESAGDRAARRSPGSGRRRRTALIVLVACAFFAVAAIAALLLTGGSEPAITPDSGRPDRSRLGRRARGLRHRPRAHRHRERRGLDVGDEQPRRDRDSGSTGRRRARDDQRRRVPGALAYGAGALWVGGEGQDVIQIDPASNRVVKHIDVGGHPTALAVGYGALWIAEPREGVVVRFDLAGRRPPQRLAAGAGPTALAVGAGSVWVAAEDSAPGRAARPRVRSRDRVDQRRATGLRPSPWGRARCGSPTGRTARSRASTPRRALSPTRSRWGRRPRRLPSRVGTCGSRTSPGSGSSGSRLTVGRSPRSSRSGVPPASPEAARCGRRPAPGPRATAAAGWWSSHPPAALTASTQRPATASRTSR